jgi:hypothetical protein
MMSKSDPVIIIEVSAKIDYQKRDKHILFDIPTKASLLLQALTKNTPIRERLDINSDKILESAKKTSIL